MERLLKQIRLVVYGVLLSGCVLQISACSSAPAKKEGSLELELLASKKINPNEKGQASPVSVRIYELKSTDAFAMSDYFTISEASDPELLTQTQKIYEGMIKPGEKREMELTPAPDAVALGVVAAYRDINHADAIKTWPIKRKDNRPWYIRWLPEGSTVLQVGIEPLAITIKEVD